MILELDAAKAMTLKAILAKVAENPYTCDNRENCWDIFDPGEVAFANNVVHNGLRDVL